MYRPKTSTKELVFLGFCFLVFTVNEEHKTSGESVVLDRIIRRVSMPRYFSTLGAPGYIQSASLYERRAVTELWSRMTAVAKQQWIWMNVPDKEDLRWLESERRLLQVYGPPGSGKIIGCVSLGTFRFSDLPDTCSLDFLGKRSVLEHRRAGWKWSSRDLYMRYPPKR